MPALDLPFLLLPSGISLPMSGSVKTYIGKNIMLENLHLRFDSFVMLVYSFSESKTTYRPIYD
jgi:hypothetical protein